MCRWNLVYVIYFLFSYNLTRGKWVLKIFNSTVCVMFGIELLVDVDLNGSGTYCGGYNRAPLPSEKGLWEPVNTPEWTERYRLSQTADSSNELLTIMDIRRARRMIGVEPTGEGEVASVRGRLQLNISPSRADISF